MLDRYKQIKYILGVYRKNSLLTKLHLIYRFITCPYLKIEEFTPREGLILDYGCGHGLFSHLLAFTFPGRIISGFDSSNLKISEALKTLDCRKEIGFTFNSEQARDLLGKADCVVMNDVLCYFTEQDRKVFLKEIFNVLKNRGLLIIKDVDKKFSFKYVLLFVQEVLAVKLLRITEAKVINFFPREHLTGILTEIGFKVKVFDIGKQYLYPHILFVCKKEKLE